MRHAKQEGADEELCKTLEALPNRRYETPAQVSKAIGEVND